MKTPENLNLTKILLTIVTKEAEAYSKTMGCARRDEIEPLPSDFKGFWISSPSNIIHLATQ